jgi:hypothetical protein
LRGLLEKRHSADYPRDFEHSVHGEANALVQLAGATLRGLPVLDQFLS